MSIVQDEFEFFPHPLLRSSQLQTYLGQIRPWRQCRLLEREFPIVLDSGPDYSGLGDGRRVRLFGYYTPTWNSEPAKGVVLLLHGWEGCSHSTYNIVLGERLCEQGYDVFRLNLRDHGPAIDLVPHALNRGVFLATLIEEVEEAVSAIASASAPLPFYIVGSSMGGNFALRLAARQDPETMPNLRHVIAISPSINPGRSIDRIDAHPALLRFYRGHWARSLRKKEALFPDTYRLEPVYGMATLRCMNDWFARHYTQYGDADSYFAQYTLTGNALVDLVTPTTIISAQDDPVVPCVDFYALSPSPKLRIHLPPYGGHVGFVDISPFRHHLPNMVGSILSKCECE